MAHTKERKKPYIVETKIYSQSAGCVIEAKPHNLIEIANKVAAVRATINSVDKVYMVNKFIIPEEFANHPEFDINHFIKNNLPFEYENSQNKAISL